MRFADDEPMRIVGGLGSSGLKWLPSDVAPFIPGKSGTAHVSVTGWSSNLTILTAAIDFGVANVAARGGSWRLLLYTDARASSRVDDRMTSGANSGSGTGSPVELDAASCS